jgi:hypothetical protein
MTRQVRGAKEYGRKTEDGRKFAPSDSGRKVLIDGLNHDLAREYEARVGRKRRACGQAGPTAGQPAP